MKYFPNLSILPVLANVKRVGFVLFCSSMLYVTPSLFCSCSGNSKGNAGNGDNGNVVAEQQTAKTEMSDKDRALKTASTQMSRISYTIHPKDNTKVIYSHLDLKFQETYILTGIPYPTIQNLQPMIFPSLL